MATTTTVAPSRRPVSLPVAGWLAAFDDWRRMRAAEAEMNRLPDHLLQDLGIERREIVDAVRRGRR